ncbi:hypothetical protein [Dyella acidisoli]|uniref:Uncharacterized protein n=1 Tax=Dyella acidisoli TaxID=1867834 RepID=A0ABQ5XSY0_9GAMM|nr:hypothetical protein [Dyella acidisoli]GLQ94452.1 hypothetical protein GCM10007901_34040 [Dyella acidisoli]
MNPTDLTASLFFSAAVRVGADISLTRLLPLDALNKPLAPHESYSQRILLSLHALGIIEPEVSQSHAEDWLLARDWMRHGFDSIAWRIRWAPRDCRRQHEEMKALLRDIELSEDTFQALLALWEDLALAEVAQYASWTLAKSGYNPEWTDQAIDALRRALKDFSASQVMYLIYLAMRTLAMTHQQGGMDATRLSQVFADAIASFARRAHVENWAIRGMTRPADLPMSILATIFAHEVTRLDDEYLTVRPSLDALMIAMARHRTIH